MSKKPEPLVHAIETSGHNRMPDTYRQHSEVSCKDELDATRETYSLMTGRGSENRMKAFADCRNRAWFVRHDDTGDLRVASKSCKLRWCPMCSKKKAWFLVQQITPWAESVEKLKFFTLTLKHTDAPIKHQVDSLYKYFQKFRKLKFLKDNIHGGIWFFQIKKSSNSGQWHPHLHCLIDAKFMDREKLSALWQRTTLGSMVVDIRSAGDPDKVAEYVGRYSARPSTLKELLVSERVELVTALHGRRLMGTWGNARNMQLAMKKPDDANKWKYIGSWFYVKHCQAFDDNAKAIYKAWILDKPLDVGINMNHIERELFGYVEHTPKEPPENRQLLLAFTEALF